MTDLSSMDIRFGEPVKMTNTRTGRTVTGLYFGFSALYGYQMCSTDSGGRVCMPAVRCKVERLDG